MTAVSEGKSLTLLDFNGVTWSVDITAADIRLDDSLLEEGDIAITGRRTGETSFKADRIEEFD